MSTPVSDPGPSARDLSDTPVVLDADDIARALTRIAHEVVERLERRIPRSAAAGGAGALRQSGHGVG